jgi:hypothetical protein
MAACSPFRSRHFFPSPAGNEASQKRDDLVRHVRRVCVCVSHLGCTHGHTASPLLAPATDSHAPAAAAGRAAGHAPAAHRPVAVAAAAARVTYVFSLSLF